MATTAILPKRRTSSEPSVEGIWSFQKIAETSMMHYSVGTSFLMDEMQKTAFIVIMQK